MAYRNKRTEMLTAQLQDKIKSAIDKHKDEPPEEKMHCICLAAMREIAKIADNQKGLAKSDARHLAARLVRQTADLVEEHQTTMFSEP